ncbi:MAG: hypothetical protein ACOVNS_08230, partial [Erythrobacter sp.]
MVSASAVSEASIMRVVIMAKFLIRFVVLRSPGRRVGVLRQVTSRKRARGGLPFAGPHAFFA